MTRFDQRTRHRVSVTANAVSAASSTSLSEVPSVSIRVPRVVDRAMAHEA
jgi:hypothetical protein